MTWAVDGTIPASFVSLITSAFADWAQYANIQFQQVASVAAAEIDFTYSFIDGLNNVLGRANYSSSGSTMLSTLITFDSGEAWHVSGDDIVSNSGVDLFVVALHEIGHALGLDHYNASAAVMNAYLSSAVTDLTQSDINGIIALYGALPPPPALYGTAGNDWMYGGGLSNTFYGGNGDNSLNGGTGVDYMYGGAGNDGLFGGDSNDSLNGGDGDDYIVGGYGNNSLYGEAGVDSLNGGPGADYIVGGAGADGLFGSDGNDQFWSGTGVDWMVGGRGADTFIFRIGDGADTIADFNVLEDRVNLGEIASVNSFADFQARAHFNGVNTVVDLGGGDQITFLNVRVETLTADLFYI